MGNSEKFGSGQYYADRAFRMLQVNVCPHMHADRPVYRLNQSWGLFFSTERFSDFSQSNLIEIFLG